MVNFHPHHHNYLKPKNPKPLPLRPKTPETKRRPRNRTLEKRKQMALLMDEEEFWKCRKHPLKRRCNGVCHLCLRDRLICLCPDCANLRPCACCPSTTSSSSSSSFSLSYSSDVPKSSADIGVTGRMSHLIDSEPAFERSRSAVFYFRRPKSGDKDTGAPLPTPAKRSTHSIWSILKLKTAKKVKESKENNEDEELMKKSKMLMRSQSVGVSCHYDSGNVSGGEARLKGWNWYFPSPIKVFRQPKTARVVQERSPLCRG